MKYRLLIPLLSGFSAGTLSQSEQRPQKKTKTKRQHALTKVVDELVVVADHVVGGAGEDGGHLRHVPSAASNNVRKDIGYIQTESQGGKMCETRVCFIVHAGPLQLLTQRAEGKGFSD